MEKGMKKRRKRIQKRKKKTWKRMKRRKKKCWKKGKKCKNKGIRKAIQKAVWTRGEALEREERKR